MHVTHTHLYSHVFTPSITHTQLVSSHFSIQPGFLCGEMRRLERCILIEAKASSCPIYLNPLWCFPFSIFQLSSSVLLAIFRLLPSGHIQCIWQAAYHSVSNQSTSDPSKMSSHLHWSGMRYFIPNTKRGTIIMHFIQLVGSSGGSLH